MDRYKKILAAVDGSECGRNAFRQACRVAREGKGTLAAIAAVPIFRDQFETLGMGEKAAAVLRGEGEKILADIRKVAEEEGVPVRTVLEEGSPLDVIRDAAEEGGYDLIVMGRRGRTHMESSLMGKVTARVIGHVKTDVMVVQRNTALGTRKVLFATDGSRHSAAAADKAIGFAKVYGGEIAALSVVDVNEEFQASAPEEVEKMARFSRAALGEFMKKAEAAGVKATVYVREGEAHQAIIETARAENANMIIMGSHGRTGLSRLLMGSVTEKVIGLALCPVLVVK